MNQFHIRRLLAWVAVASALIGQLASAAETSVRPNIVFILMDDLGWTDLACTGSTFHRTPHLDRMAREGMRFSAAYAAGPVCSPTRAALLTGQSPARLHLTDWLPGRGDRADQKLRRPVIATNLPSNLNNLAKALRGAGYRTAHVGKWHLGGAGSLPTDHGFDRNVAGDHRGTPLSYIAPFKKGDDTMPGLERASDGEYLTDRLTADAVEFLRQSAGQPFFLYLSHYAVHIPLTAKSNLVASYEGKRAAGSTQSNAVYAAMVESMDESVGRILRTLTELRLDGKTLVVFTSDNGGLSAREGPNTPATSNTPLRAGKGYLYEGGLRVPLLVRWPGVVPAGSVVSTPVITTDWMSTLLDLAGVPRESNVVSDGVTLAGLLKGGAPPQRDALFWHYPHYSNQGGKPGGATRNGDWKLIEHYESGYLELFNLAADPGEATNVAGAFPERANALAKTLADWRRSSWAQMMTTNTEYVPVPIAQAADGRVILPAHEVAIHGTTVRYEPPAHKNTVGYWTKSSDWVSWDFAIKQPGKFIVEVLQGCGKGSGGSEVEISVGDQKVAFTVIDTGHFQNFVAREIGSIHIARPGSYTLMVKPRRKPGVAVMDLRQVVLKPEPL